MEVIGSGIWAGRTATWNSSCQRFRISLPTFKFEFLFLLTSIPYPNPSVDPHLQDGALQEVQVDEHERERKPTVRRREQGLVSLGVCQVQGPGDKAPECFLFYFHISRWRRMGDLRLRTIVIERERKQSSKRCLSLSLWGLLALSLSLSLSC